MPPLMVVADSWHFSAAAFTMVLLFGVPYAVGIRAAARDGAPWPRWRIAAFYLLGLAGYAFTLLGFPSVFSQDLRWVFAIKVALLLVVVPLLLSLGKPLALARASLHAPGPRRVLSVLTRGPLHFLGHPVIAPLIGMAVFTTMLTPLSGMARTSPGVETVLALALPVLGLFMVLPMMEGEASAGTSLMVLELLFVFIELMADAVPGMALRLNNHVLDHAPSLTGIHPVWFPGPLVDQHLAGDWLWFICEIAGLPIHVMMVRRFLRNDARDAQKMDAYSDQEMDAMTETHLAFRGPQ